MRLTTIGELDSAARTAAFNLIYEGYLMQVTVDEGWMTAHLCQNDIDMDHSPLLLDVERDAVVGLAILGVRGDRGWVGGFGVAPNYRGRGLSHELIGQTIACARDTGVGALVLEVLQPNAAAIRTYTRAGFVRTRALLIYERAPSLSASPSAETLRARTPAELLATRGQFNAPRPAWQRAPESLNRIARLEGVSLDDDSAWAIVKSDSGRLRIYDIAAGDSDASMRLLQGIADAYPDSAMVIVNEPEGSPVIPALVASGWTEAIHQWEMTLRVR